MTAMQGSLFTLTLTLVLFFLDTLSYLPLSLSLYTAVRLRINDLKFGEQTSEENKQKLNKIFFNGQLHIYWMK